MVLRYLVPLLRCGVRAALHVQARSRQRRPPDRDRLPRRALDIGCGTGILAARLADSAGASEVIGCDFSRGMLERAVARASHVDWVQGDAQRLPLRTASVDVVTCTESFHWYPDPEAALAEFGRVLRPGGTLYVALVNTRARMLSDVAGLGFRLAGQPLVWPTLGEMRDRITGAGFRVTRQERVARFPPGILFPTVLTTAVRTGPQGCTPPV
ncbi:MAG: methyltransferase domain-containing protein [Acidimicrobiia bacterium]|nr:methyltransferase domain-containing protein [Acidimicrobiia bacterium]